MCGQADLYDELRARVGSWPPPRLARLCREHGFVVVVSPVAPAFDTGTVRALEDMTGPLGPMDPVLDLLDLPPDLRARLAPPTLRNTRGGPKLRARMLKVNRSGLSDRQALVRRRRMLKRWRERYGRENRQP